jgi:hypothetical protein
VAGAIPVTKEEYLHTAYDPDCEFEGGVLTERTGGTVPVQREMERWNSPLASIPPCSATR